MKTKLSGLHLWEVGVRCWDGHHWSELQLWITTPKESISQATSKAQKFLRPAKGLGGLADEPDQASRND